MEAHAFIDNHIFFQIAFLLCQHMVWLIVVLGIVPVLVVRRLARRAKAAGRS